MSACLHQNYSMYRQQNTVAWLKCTLISPAEILDKVILARLVQLSYRSELVSNATTLLPVRSAASTSVPVPANGEHTRSPAFENLWMTRTMPRRGFCAGQRKLWYALRLSSPSIMSILFKLGLEIYIYMHICMHKHKPYCNIHAV